jgi:predicted Zn-dependent peptidase
MSKADLKEEFFQHQYSSGIRLLHKQSRGPVCHLSIIVRAGSRDEEDDEQGMAHFVEHCLFKGTKKRKTYHILSRLDDVGGELNAYTGKEDTTLYASVLDKDYRRAAELLVDIAFNSTFPEKEIKKEQEVIADEIRSYEDSPSDHIFDLFDELMFPDHPLGKNILGTPSLLKTFTREKILAFTSRLYKAGHIVIASSGPMSGEQVLKTWEALLGDQIPLGIGEGRLLAGSYSAVQKKLETSHVQTHCVLGNRAYSSADDKSLGFYVLNNILGGPTMNNRLNLRIRERFGMTYHLESFYTSMSDAGAWGVYLSTEPAYADRVIRMVERELKDLREKPLGILQLSRAKKQVQGQIAMAQENPGSSVSAAARSWLHKDEIEPLQLILKRIDDLRAQDLLELANEIFNPNELSQLVLVGKGHTLTD